ncbi:MAG: hypothetical protein JXJ22_06075 [Bacteroidales bacterium]|nr:hypothetical protein [Bacteroidales bacterium]
MGQKLELEQISEKEFRVGETRIILLTNNILYIEAVGEQTDEHAAVIRKNYKTIYSLFPGKVKQLVNLNQSGKSSPAARVIYKEMNEYELTEKVAVFGMHPVARVLAAFVTSVTSTKNIKFFSTEEEALLWLKKN